MVDNSPELVVGDSLHSELKYYLDAKTEHIAH